MRVIQLLPELHRGDAIGNDTLAIRDILWEAGYETMIYALKAGPGLTGDDWKHVDEMPALYDDDLLVYHACVGTELNYRLPGFGGRKVMIYHNITPPEFFYPYSSHNRGIMEYGLDGIRYLADKIDYAIAVSDYNRQELRKMGYTCPIDICPIVIPFEDYDREPDPAVTERYRNDGMKHWLFVGRISPNKKIEDVIRAFACYQRDYEPESRLFLIGSTGSTKLYDAALKNYIKILDLEDRVVMPGRVSFAEILAYYRLADIFVCMSKHEGFCVPLVEAMHFGVPIVACASSAIPDTLGRGGLLLTEKEPDLAAAAAHRVLADEALREALREGQKAKLDEYAYGAVKERLLECLRKAAAI